MCAGGSELSDAMSEGERPDEISSLSLEGHDNGTQPLFVCLHRVMLAGKAGASCGIRLLHPPTAVPKAECRA